jgi:hypothetical protein
MIIGYVETNPLSLQGNSYATHIPTEKVHLLIRLPRRKTGINLKKQLIPEWILDY